MKVLPRCGLALGLVVLLYGGLGPALSGQIDELRIRRSAPLQIQSVRRKIALLPAESQQSGPVLQLVAALERDGQWSNEDQRWSRGVATVLTDAQRQQGLSWADLTSPSHPPPMEASGVDGDLCYLASLLLQNYGYEPTEVAEPPAQDSWIGVDRRSRTRVLVALAEHAALQPDQAQQLLGYTFLLLQAQAKRATNLETIKNLLPVAMGER